MSTLASIDVKAGAVLLAAMLFSLPLIASDTGHDESLWKPPVLTFTIGRSLPDFNSQVRADSKRFGLGTTIDLEDDIGYKESDNFDRFQLIWDINPKHTVALTYLPLNRQAKAALNKDITYEDVTIGADAFVESKTKIDIYDIQYSYNIIANDRHKLGLAAGIHWISWDFSIDAYGAITDLNNDTTVVDGSYQSQDEFDAPLPLIGINYSYQLGNHWRFSFDAKALELSVDDYSGRMFLANAAAEYFITRNWGLGLSVGAFDIEVEADTSDYLGAVEWNYSGLNAYLIARF